MAVTKKSLLAKATETRRKLRAAEATGADDKVLNRLSKLLSNAEQAVKDWQPTPKVKTEPLFEMGTVEVIEGQHENASASAESDQVRETQEEAPSMTATTEEIQSTEDGFYDSEAQTEGVAPSLGLRVGDEPPTPFRKERKARAAGGPRKGKWDAEVEYLFEHPDVSARLYDRKSGEPLTVTNSSIKQSLQKKYDSWSDDEGRKLIVTVIKLDEKSYGVWVKVSVPEVSQPVAVESADGSSESVVPSDSGEL